MPAAVATKKDEQKRRLSFNDVKNRLKNLNINKKEKYKGMCLKVTTSKMRCSIKVKEEFENVGGNKYLFSISVHILMISTMSRSHICQDNSV